MLNKESINQAKALLGLDKCPELNIVFKEGNEEHAVTVKRDHDDVTIYYSRTVTAFYGLTILKENIKKDAFEVSEDNKFEHNGSMFDCSRNEVPNVKTIKKILLYHAVMGLNRFMLYTEDTYEMDNEPYFGYFRGRYTGKEIKDIVAYAETLGIDVVPCIQTMGHLNHAIKWAAYNVLADTGHLLNVEDERIYPLIEKMIKTTRENFKSEYIHIGMDEADDIGMMAFMKENRLVDKRGNLLKHLNRVVEICEKYNFKPMMWADMFFKADPKAAKDWWYNFKGMFDEATKKNIPNVELVYWNYYDDELDRYDNNLKTSLDTGKYVTFAGGFIRWCGYTTNVTPSLRKGNSGLKAAVKNKVKSVFCTTWGDSNSGAAALSYLPGLAQYCAFDYSNGSSKKISKILKAVTGISLEEWEKIELPNRLEDTFEMFENNSVFFLYQDPLLGLFDTRVKYKYEGIYADHAKVLKKAAKKAGELGYIWHTGATLCDCLSLKVSLGKRLREQYKANDKEGLKETVKQIKLAVKKLDVFIKAYKEQWFLENKPFGYEIQEGRTGWLKQRMLSAAERVTDYIEGKIDSIEEFEEDPLQWNGVADDTAICANQWHLIVSASSPL